MILLGDEIDFATHATPWRSISTAALHQRDATPCPFARKRWEGDQSSQTFRDEILDAFRQLTELGVRRRKVAIKAVCVPSNS
jgi:hypothetical protein